ncbi:hypothetical protein V5O48_017317 [Marasmius crinis-equi]|uniref:SWIM-type domain-containing protein n=1 Tax=Marasmius crinis-equi TaxID=585013 RepID=A0ABR3EPD4_9AGAR
MPRKRKAPELAEQDSDSSIEIVSFKKARPSQAIQSEGEPSTSTYTYTSAAGPSTKPERKRKAKEKKEAPEKRLARYRSSCPSNILDRLDRAMAQRERQEGELKEDFTVSGSTGNVYTVYIDNRPSCNCPDAMKGNHCKHILFVFLKVLQVKRGSTHWYQKALLNSELHEIFDSAPAPPQLRAHGSLADERVIEAWKGATGRATSQPSASSSSSSGTRRLPSAEDDCAICYDSMYDEKKTTVEALVGILEWCRKCGNAVHKGCWDNYLKFQKTASDGAKCVWCRAPWHGGSKSSGSGMKAHEGYVNLAGLPGLEDLDTVRDTSTYYSRGRYHGY